MPVADAFRGLAEIDFASQPGAVAGDPYVGAYPTFRTFAPVAGTTRDEVVLVRASAARRRARPLVNAPGGLAAWDESDVPAVFRALNPATTPTDSAYPTFTYGFSRGTRFMNVIDLHATAARRVVAPAGTPGLADLTDVEASFRGAHAWALTNGFATAFPTFRVATIGGVAGAELVAFPQASSGVSLNSAGAAGTRSWTFRSLEALNEGGLALVTVAGGPVLLNVFDDRLAQFRPGAPSPLHEIDPDATGTRRAAVEMHSEVSAVTSGTRVHVIWSGSALHHASRPLLSPGAWTFRVVSGRESPAPEGLVGHFNTLLAAPDGSVHAFAFLHRPPGTAAGTFDPVTTGNLLHSRFDGSSWSAPATVDGDGDGALAHVDGSTGQSLTGVAEPDGTIHAFYTLSDPTPDGQPPGSTQRLRHAVLTAAGWVAETLDGSGAPQPPATPGTGPTRASVGANVSGAFFAGSIWLVYEDRTWGNLRCARGTRTAGGSLGWDFHVLDGGSHRGSTPGVVRAAVTLVWDDVLSVFYADETRQVLRHAYRRAADTRWTYELLDGDGGTDGRVNAGVFPILAAAASRGPAGTPTTPVFVAYRWDAPTSSPGVRLATLA